MQLPLSEFHRDGAIDHPDQVEAAAVAQKDADADTEQKQRMLEREANVDTFVT